MSDGRTFALLIQLAGSAKDGTPEHARAHGELWLEWLTLSLERQTREIERIVLTTGQSELLVMPELYAKVTAPGFIPASATAAERDLFMCNFEASMALILGAAVQCTLRGKSRASDWRLEPCVA